MIKKIEYVYPTLFAIYLSLGPIYWIPFFGADAVGYLKTGIFMWLVLWPILKYVAGEKIFFPGGKSIFLLIIIFIILSIPGVLRGKVDDSLYSIQNSLQIVFFLFACGYLIKRGFVALVGRLATVMFFIWCGISLFFMLFSPDILSPLNEQLTIAQTGFGGSRTSWSPAVALFLPWIYSGFALTKISNSWILLFIGLANQLVVGGRGGIVATIFSGMIYAFSMRKIKIFIGASLIFTFFVIFLWNNPDYIRVESGGEGGVEGFSSGRISLFFGALEEILLNPIFGIGFGLGDYNGVHNVVIRVALEAGIPYAVFFVAIIAFAVIRGWRGLRKNDVIRTAAFLTIFAGLIDSMLEPVAMLGSFNNFSFWWFAFSVCVTRGSLQYKYSGRGSADSQLNQ